ADNEYPQISDGQQRLATTTMILAAFRDYLLAIGKTEDALSIERDFLFKRVRGEGDKPRLTLNVDDHEFFENSILVQPRERTARRKEKKLKDSHKKLEKASQIIREYFEQRLAPEKTEQKVKVINKWINFIEKHAIVVAIDLSAELDPYMTFETMNDRGLE